jgi:hypothetical protein
MILLINKNAVDQMVMKIGIDKSADGNLLNKASFKTMPFLNSMMAKNLGKETKTNNKQILPMIALILKA